MSYDKRYIDTFLAGKPDRYKLDFEMEAKHFKNINYDIGNILFKKYVKNNFGSKFIGISVFQKSYIQIFFVRNNKFCVYGIKKDEFYKNYRELIFHDII